MNLKDDFYEEAIKSKIGYHLSSAIIKNKKLLTKPYGNIERNYYRGILNGSLHAEINALIHYYGKRLQYDKIKKKWILKMENKNKVKINVIVMRFNNNKELLNARPCFHCLNIMKDINVNKIYYTSNNNEIICENVKDMVSLQVSTVSRKYFNNEVKEKIYDNMIELNDKILREYYFKNLLKNNFPLFIKKNSLYNFIKYNYINILPEYSYKILQNKIYFYDKNNNIIFISFILNL